jgi:hypothetical protein
MGDEKRLEDGRQEAGLDPSDSSLAGAIDNATSEELDAQHEDGTETGPVEEDPAIVRAREMGTTAPKLS